MKMVAVHTVDNVTFIHIDGSVHVMRGGWEGGSLITF